LIEIVNEFCENAVTAAAVVTTRNNKCMQAGGELQITRQSCLRCYCFHEFRHCWHVSCCAVTRGLQTAP